MSARGCGADFRSGARSIVVVQAFRLSAPTGTSSTRLPRRFVISATVQARLARWGGVPKPNALHPPAPARPYHCDDYGDYIFAVSRLTPLKRFDLLLDALAAPVAQGHPCGDRRRR